MTGFKIGDIVYLKDELVEKFKRHSSGATVLAPGQGWAVQFALAKDIPLTIIDINDYNLAFYLTNSNDSWGGPVFLKEYKAWILYGDEIEKREELNTVSLYELNRGL